MTDLQKHQQQVGRKIVQTRSQENNYTLPPLIRLEELPNNPNEHEFCRMIRLEEPETRSKFADATQTFCRYRVWSDCGKV